MKSRAALMAAVDVVGHPISIDVIQCGPAAGVLGRVVKKAAVWYSPLGCLKLNVDKNSQPEEAAGYGRLIRDFEANESVTYAGTLTSHHANAAELWILLTEIEELQKVGTVSGPILSFFFMPGASFLFNHIKVRHFKTILVTYHSPSWYAPTHVGSNWLVAQIRIMEKNIGLGWISIVFKKHPWLEGFFPYPRVVELMPILS